MSLTDTQRTILTAAAQQQDRLVKPPAIPAGPRGAIEAKLRNAGLIEQMALGADEHPAMAWRRADSQAIGYRITEDGLRAIGMEREDEQSAAAIERRNAERRAVEAEMPQEASQESAEAGDRAETAQAPPEPPPSQGAPQAPIEAVPAARGATALRTAATALLAAWEAPEHLGVDQAIATLRAALAGKPARQARTPCGPATPRKPREGTKQEQVLTLLRRSEGATIVQIMEVTGWQQHTVRGFFAGLKKRQGIAVEVMERVRQVGPNKQGARGSYSIYRIADAG